MILVDTSVWVDHLRMPDGRMAWLLGQSQVLTHPFIIGELALHSIAKRDAILSDLLKLPQATTARHEDVIALIAKQSLHGRGIGYVDTHLYASVLLTPGAQLWTKDERLHGVAKAFGLAAKLEH